MRRRDVLRLLAAVPAFACTKSGADAPTPREHATSPSTSVGASPSSARMPVIFAAHGAPILLDDTAWVAELAGWAKAMPRPTSILVVSAHWEQTPVKLGATRAVPLVYDFYGFPERYYQTKYPAPGAPTLASRVRELLAKKSIAAADAPDRGLDHGAYIPLVAMYPEANVPVLQLSLPALDPKVLLALGAALAPLRDEGVLVFGSGFLTHNMGYAFREGTPSWAREFDAWAEEHITKLDVDALSDFRARAPAAATALPTWEHYAPLLVALGSLDGSRPSVSYPITGFWNGGAFTRRSVQMG